MCCSRIWLPLGAAFAGLAVVAGAFGAHGLDAHFAEKYAQTPAKSIAGFEAPASWKYLEDYKTGVRYQMWHALGLVAVGLLSLREAKRSLQIAGAAFTAGIVLFCGSLYVLTIAGPHWLGVTWGLVAPFGGAALIVGWITLAAAVWPCRSDKWSGPISRD